MDRFDIVLGHYVYYALHHTGQGSKEYERLSRILDPQGPFKLRLSPLFSEDHFLEDVCEGDYTNARIVYDNLCERR